MRFQAIRLLAWLRLLPWCRAIRRSTGVSAWYLATSMAELKCGRFRELPMGRETQPGSGNDANKDM